MVGRLPSVRRSDTEYRSFIYQVAVGGIRKTAGGIPSNGRSCRVGRLRETVGRLGSTGRSWASRWSGHDGYDATRECKTALYSRTAGKKTWVCAYRERAPSSASFAYIFFVVVLYGDTSTYCRQGGCLAGTCDRQTRLVRGARVF